VFGKITSKSTVAPFQTDCYRSLSFLCNSVIFYHAPFPRFFSNSPAGCPATSQYYTFCEQTKKMDVYVESKVFDDALITRQRAFADIRDMLFTFNEG